MITKELFSDSLFADADDPGLSGVCSFVFDVFSALGVDGVSDGVVGVVGSGVDGSGVTDTCGVSGSFLISSLL